MLRLLLLSVLLSAVVIGFIVFVVGPMFPQPKPKPDDKDDPAPAGAARGNGEQRLTPVDNPLNRSTATQPLADRDVRVHPVPAAGGADQLLIIQDGRVLTMERQEVPSERDGKLLAVATYVGPDEYIPPEKLIELEVAVLGVEYKPTDDLTKPLGGNRRITLKEPFLDPVNKKQYRFPRVEEKLEAATTRVVRLRVRLRKLAENDEVKEGQLVGIINPAVAIEDMEIKRTKVAAAVSDVAATNAMLEESRLRLEGANKAARSTPGAISRDDLGAARVTVDKYRSEKVQKEAQVEQAQQELAGAWTTLDLYFIRAMIPGRIRTLYKQSGEAVKNLDPVMQIQNTKKLRVEAQVEVQDALPLHALLRDAERRRAEAMAKDKSDPKYAAALRAQADELTRVQVEVTRPVRPKAVLSGDTYEITAVAVTRDDLPRIVSASEQGMVRVWGRDPGPDERWREQATIPHHVAVRALACSGREAVRNILVTATATGRLRMIDLNKLDTAEPIVFGKGEEKARHVGAINAVALNGRATICASAGEDRSICIWDPGTGNLLRKKENAHNNGVTSLMFTANGRLVSAGRDGRLAVWKWEDDLLTEVDALSGRSNAVAQLGVDLAGDRVLFDEGRELRVMSIASTRHHIEGTLANPGSSGTFSTMALFSPDGKTILTNGNAAGRLQLWRAPGEGVRAAELRQLLWSTGAATCGTFDPAGQFAVTGTSDHRVLVWDLPREDEAKKPLDANLTYVEEFLETGLKKVTVRATIKDAKDWVIPGSAASIVVLPRPAGK